MRGGIKLMKKLFLIFLLLFTPVSAYTDGGTVITSSGQLTEKILPLDFDLMHNVYRDIMYKYNCTDKKSIFDAFLEGKVSVPFSGQELLKVCKSVTRDLYDPFDNPLCRKRCSNFVLTYMQEIAKSSKPSEI